MASSARSKASAWKRQQRAARARHPPICFIYGPPNICVHLHRRPYGIPTSIGQGATQGYDASPSSMLSLSPHCQWNAEWERAYQVERRNINATHDYTIDAFNDMPAPRDTTHAQLPNTTPTTTPNWAMRVTPPGASVTSDMSIGSVPSLMSRSSSSASSAYPVGLFDELDTDPDKDLPRTYGCTMSRLAS